MPGDVPAVIDLEEKGFLVCCCSDMTVRFLDLREGKKISTIPLQTRLTTMTKLKGKRLLVSGDLNGFIEVWRIIRDENNEFKVRKTMFWNAHTYWVSSLCELIETDEARHIDNNNISGSDLHYNSNSNENSRGGDDASGRITPGEVTIASGAWDKTVSVWDLKTNRRLATCVGHAGQILSLIEVRPWIIASGSIDQTVKVWNVKSGECLQTLTGHGAGVTTLVKLKKENYGVVDDDPIILFSGSLDHTMRIWNPTTGECLGVVSFEVCVTSALSLDDGTIVVGFADGNIVNVQALLPRFIYHHHHLYHLSSPIS